MKRGSDAKAARRTRRTHSAAFKREVVEKTLQPHASVAAIALEHRLNTNLLFKWRRDHMRELARRAPAPTMLPVMLETSSPLSAAEASKPRINGGVIEIELAAGRVRLKGAVDVESLRAVLELLRQ